MRHRTITLAVVALLATSALAGTGAGALAGGQSPLALTAQETQTTTDAANDSTITAGTGAQVSTVIASASDDVQTEYEETSFEAAFRSGNETERAAAIANRSAELDARAAAIRAEYEDVTRAFENGSISREAYAQRVATLNARAKNVRNSSERLDRRADDVARVELRAAGLNGTELNSTIQTLAAVSGPGQNALLAKFTGESSAEIEVRSGNGVRIEVESEDGERSREFRRSGDRSTAITVEQSVALANARSNLSTSAGSWDLADASVHEEDGEYRFEFLLSNGSERGEAEVRVDGSSGAVVRVEEELERPESDEAEDERESDELSLVVTDGTVAANETVTVQVRAGTRPVANVPVSLDGESVGETDANGTVIVALPADDDARIEADDGDRDARLELEFEGESGDDDAATDTEDETETADATETETETENETESETQTATPTPSADDVNLDASLDDGTVTLTLTDDGSPIEGAALSVNSDSVGATDASGVVSFQVESGEEDYDVRFEKDGMEVRTEYVVENGTIERTEAVQVT